MIKPLQFLLSAKRKNKRIITICYDIVAVMLSLYLAIGLRLNEWIFTIQSEEFASLFLTVAVTIYAFTKLGMYRAVLRYMMLPALGYIFISVVLSALALALSGFFFQTFIPRSVPLIYAGLATLTLGGPRILIRTFYYHYYKRKKPNVFIYGAGATGRELAYALISGDEYHPVVILDDDLNKVGQIIFGLRVHHSDEFESLKSLYEPVKLLIAINNISKGSRLRLVEKLSNWPIAIQSVPSVEDIELGYRIRNAGGRISLVPELQCKHLKVWRFINLVHTEFFRRALPWSRLLLRQGQLTNDLNVGVGERLRAGLSILLVLSSFASVLGLLTWWAPLAILIIALLANSGFINFFYHKNSSALLKF